MKSGFVAIIGSANAGKSTLINTILGEKISIVSRKPQTTRENITGIYNEDDTQIVFIDTPGLHKSTTELGNYMASCVQNAANSVDVILLVLDSTKGIRERELLNINKYKKLGIPMTVALNKVDLLEKEKLLPMIARLAENGVDSIVPISALKNKNLDDLIKELKKYLTGEDILYPEDILTDKSDKYYVAEIIREKILARYDAEIPHGVCISINKFEYNQGGEIYDIDADIICEKKGHKSIIIGKNGEAIKYVSTAAREEMERYLEHKVFLTLWVRVKEDWRNTPNMLTQLGYDKRELTE